MDTSVCVQDISKTVRDNDTDLTLLTQIDFSITSGSSLAITGPSGSGKTTLLSILAGLDTPSSGRVHLLGQDIFAQTENQRAAFRAQFVGFVFQSFHLLPHLTALENVLLPLELRGEKNMRQKALSALDSVQLSHRSHQYPLALSGGEQQRVAIARAIVIEPTIIFADEPTGNLDSQTGKRIWGLLQQLQTERQMTMVVVTHDRQLAQQCNYQLEIAEGQMNSFKKEI